MKKYLGFLLFFVATVQAQTVPAIDKTAAVAPMAIDIPQAAISLDAKEKAALRIARDWKNNPDKPTRAADGSVKYLFGATMPTMFCTPLEVCQIRLQAGEIVNEDGVHAGDASRWRISPSTVGSGPTATTNVVVKPTEQGIVTNLIINTNRRSYIIKLVASRHESTPLISFSYPDENEQAWRDYQAKQVQVAHATTLSTGENIAAVDFRFKIGGDNPKWAPQRVYANDSKTIIQFANEFVGTEAPALIVLGKDAGLFKGPAQKTVNYRPIGDRYVVDYVLGVGEKFALLSGVGAEETRVIIEYRGGEK